MKLLIHSPTIYLYFYELDPLDLLQKYPFIRLYSL